MKLLRIGPAGAEQPAVLADDGALLDLTGLTGDIDGALLSAGLDVLRDAMEGGDLRPLSCSCGSTEIDGLGAQQQRLGSA